MPEGDTIFRTAQNLHRALAGERVVRFESVLPALSRVDTDHPLAGRTIESVTARGKHVLMAFSGDLVLHTHMRMNGSWHLYRPGERWQRPRRDLRLLVATEPFVAVGFNVPIAELLSGRDLARHRELAALGPDLLDAAFDRAGAIRRMRAHPRDAVADVLLNQRVVAGIGNVLKSEILFVAGIDPFTPIGRLDEERLGRVVEVARSLLAANVLGRAATLSVAIGRRTTRSLDPGAKLWVYGRGGRPCRKCGAPVQVRASGTDARLTYWCARCQVPA
jgi:endonuclease VIII